MLKWDNEGQELRAKHGCFQIQNPPGTACLYWWLLEGNWPPILSFVICKMKEMNLLNTHDYMSTKNAAWRRAAIIRLLLILFPLIFIIRKIWEGGWWDNSEGKLCMPLSLITWVQFLHGSRKLTLAICPVNSICIQWHMYMYTTHTNKCLKIFRNWEKEKVI